MEEIMGLMVMERCLHINKIKSYDSHCMRLASTAVVSDNAGLYEIKNTSTSVKINGPRSHGSINGHQVNGGINKTCLSLNGYTPGAKGSPLSGEFIQINGRMNGHPNGYVKSSFNTFANNNSNGYDPVSVNLKNHRHKNNSGDQGHFRSHNDQVNGHSKNVHNGYSSNHLTNGYMNNSFEIESKNNKNVTFRIDTSLLRNGGSVDKSEVTPLKKTIGEEMGISISSKGKLKHGEITDEISTEL
ncbi:hypothetical protein SK128_026141 [Halocaridina rubra]|uniref:Uncharacterized protein n=1 Tax=Halocaridina rubra TaxID=373956 RepID=A0AAN9AEP0_HALRR